jgi:hypothetical protein
MREVTILPPRHFPIDEALARRIYAVLVEYAGASSVDGEAYAFAHAVSVKRTDEYRFQGWLGFGGKFRNNHSGVYVDCYAEDETEKRRAHIDTCNAKLRELIGPTE